MRETTKPSLKDRVLNWSAAVIVPYPNRLRWMIKMAPAIALAGRVLRAIGLKDVAALGDAVPTVSGGRAVFAGPGTAATKRDRRGRVILLAGCAQQVLRPEINDATIRLLARSGIDVEVAAGAGCCGAAAEQAGDRERARQFARANIDAWTKSMTRGPVDAIICNAAGCGVAVKDYPELLSDDPAYAMRAAEIAAKARDISEFIAQHGLGPPRRWSSLKVAFMAPCQLQHGQGIVTEPGQLIHDAGFTLVDMPEEGMCCGAGGAYSYREADIADKLRMRKADHILAVRPDVVAMGSIGCMKHMESEISTPIVHVVELIDWAYGGPVPSGLEAFKGESTDVPGPPPLDVDDYIRA
jgi:glycolate oxidase iron-sulfur subunit